MTLHMARHGAFDFNYLPPDAECLRDSFLAYAWNAVIQIWMEIPIIELE